VQSFWNGMTQSFPSQAGLPARRCIVSPGKGATGESISKTEESANWWGVLLPNNRMI